ncbi:hypothetical protein LMG28688_06359 [Paraburkholderia caffeinitolerans]|uniref:Uncharacterized protein n=1 Tax=Paraburkholderia caffeinitolerans TaxID=1723730 RepID=A0A6J5GT05_9BURK|nr:hypothetical protein LMG28688_06359 [Paraburkholderia caffeinitolerans]
MNVSQVLADEAWPLPLRLVTGMDAQDRAVKSSVAPI